MGKVFLFLIFLFLGGLAWILAGMVDMGSCYQIQKDWKQKIGETMILRQADEEKVCLEGKETYLLVEKCWTEKVRKWEKRGKILAKQAKRLLEFSYGKIEEIKEKHNEECLKWEESLIENVGSDGTEYWSFE